MALFDLSLPELEDYLPIRYEPSDFDAFWQASLERVRSHELNVGYHPTARLFATVDVYDLVFNGFDGQSIRGWLLTPHSPNAPLPCVVEYIGYNGGRGLPIDWLGYASAGYAHLVMDTRGQGGGWKRGDTPDLYAQGGSPQVAGWLTRGILDPHHHYYRRLYCDAVRAVEAARTCILIDPSRIAVAGTSQGGGVALAVSGLSDVDLCMADVPFLCHIRQAIEITDASPYAEVQTFCRNHRDRVEQVFETLSYIDAVNFVPRAKAKALFSVGLMDDVCPPRTVFAAFNHYAGEKSINVYPYNRHEGGESVQATARIDFLHEHWRTS
jgi:cephalosporin-C deacetylase